jgi:hypothetical protein
MSGEQFVAVMGAGFAAFVVWLVAQIINRERWAIPIAVGSGICVLLVAAIFADMMWTMRGL